MSPSPAEYAVYLDALPDLANDLGYPLLDATQALGAGWMRIEKPTEHRTQEPSPRLFVDHYGQVAVEITHDRVRVAPAVNTPDDVSGALWELGRPVWSMERTPGCPLPTVMLTAAVDYARKTHETLP